MLTLPESARALAALIALCPGDREALGLLRRLVRRVRPDGRAPNPLEEDAGSSLGRAAHRNESTRLRKVDAHILGHQRCIHVVKAESGELFEAPRKSATQARLTARDRRERRAL
jgi:hypothetical protein